MDCQQQPDEHEDHAEGEHHPEALPFPESDMPPQLQRTLARKLAEEESGDGASISEPEFKEALQKVARHRQSD